MSTEPLKLLFQNEDLIAVDKPSGLLMHRSRESSDRQFLLQRLSRQVRRVVYPVHRLDRAASGVVLFGTSPSAAAEAQRALAESSARKYYLALIRWPGSGPELGDEWTLDRPLHDDRGIARDACTSIRVVEHLPLCALASVRILTGRRHQIRRHLNHCGRHVLGDTTHGKGRINRLFRERYGLLRLFLHASKLVFCLPGTGAATRIEAPLPRELNSVLDRLRAEVSRD